VHPNEEASNVDASMVSRRPSYLLPTGSEPIAWADSRFVKWFIDFDETVLRPFLIYKYSVDRLIQEDNLEE
jgi:hypothetical protein